MSWDGIETGWPSPWALDPPKAYDEWHLRRDRIRARLARYEEHRKMHGKSEEFPRNVGGISMVADRNGIRPALGASAGPVSGEQAGILPTGRFRISDEMIARACIAHPDVAPAKIRAILEMALRA